MSLSIRDATHADLPAVRDLLIETWHHTYDRLYGEGAVNEINVRWHSVDKLAEQVARDGSAFLVAEDKGTIVATSFAGPTPQGHIGLGRIYVRPALQGTGIGRELMAATLARFPQGQAIRLEVDPLNWRALRFYEMAGFRVCGEVTSMNDLGGEVIVALAMERTA